MTNLKHDKKRIICGTDFSIHASEAADVAAALAKRLDEALVLVHVEDQVEFIPSHPGTFAADLIQTREQLHDEAERLRPVAGTVKEELLTGSPYQGLVDVASRSSTRLLIVSSLGQIAPSQFLVGSVAERTAESSPIPTLIVKCHVPLTEWATGKRPLKIVICDDFSANSEAALRWTNEFRQIGPCDIVVAHVNWPPEDRHRLGVHSPAAMTENPVVVQRALERDLTERAIQVFGENVFKIHVRAGWGRADLHLIEIAKNESADLIVVGTHQRQGINRIWLGSVSRGILHHAPTNIAVIPIPLGSENHVAQVPQFKRVFVTTDFSELGNAAIPYAYAMVRRGGMVKLIHVLPPWEKPNQLLLLSKTKPSTADQHEKVACNLARKLDSLIPAQAETLGIITDCEVVQGNDVGQVITHQAEQFSADIICLGSHGRSGLSKAILGSVAQTVMGLSKRPVLVIRPKS
jgi:nucleotide-binding universal stress UspA family protein